MKAFTWHETQPGKMIVDTEKKVLEELLTGTKASHVLKIGGPHDDLTHLMLIDKLICINDTSHSPSTLNVLASAAQLPFQSNSMDMILLWHAFDRKNPPRHLISEAYRVLKPGCQLIIIDFNRFGFWNAILRKKLHLEHTKFYSTGTIKHYLQKLSCDIAFDKTVHFHFPVSHLSSTNRWQFLEKLFSTLFPRLGAIMIIKAIKKVRGVHPLISPSWKENLSLPPETVIETPTRSYP